MLGFGLLESNTPTAAVFTPLSISGLHSYYTSDVCTASGGTVTVVPDQSGNGETSLTVVAAAPIYTSSDSNFNGLPSFGATSAERRLQGTFHSQLNQPSTYYMVIKVESGNNTMYWRSNQGNFTDSAGFYIQPDRTATMQTQDSSSAISSSSPVAAGIYVSCAIYNSTGVSALYLNNSGTAIMHSPGDGSVDANSCLTLTVGSLDSETYSWTAAANYSGAHDHATRTQLMNYFGNKYGITTT